MNHFKKGPLARINRKFPQACTFVTIPIMKTFKTGSELVQKALFTAPSESLQHMNKDSKFTVIWDTGASISISPNKHDFIKLKKSSNKSLLGISKGLKIEGQGIVNWCLTDETGNVRTFEVPALYVPSCNVRLLRPNAITEQFPDESITIEENGLRLSGANNEPSRGTVFAKISKANNLPTSVAFTPRGLHEAAYALNATISVVHDSNLNLTPSQKYFLQWHWRLGHPGFAKLTYLFRSGVLSNSVRSSFAQCRCYSWSCQQRTNQRVAEWVWYRYFKQEEGIWEFQVVHVRVRTVDLSATSSHGFSNNYLGDI